MDSDLYAKNYWAEEHHWWYLGRRRILLRLLDGWVRPTDGTDRTVLDVGCGTGKMLSELDRYGRAQGVDMHEEAANFCRARGIDDVQLIDEPPYPFDDESFDLVTVLDVIEHVADDVAVLREIRRLLRPEGMVLVTVPAYMSLWSGEDRASHHLRRYRAEQLRERMIAAGFEIRRLSYFNTFMFPVVAAVRLARRIRADSETLVDSDYEISAPNFLHRRLADIFAAEAPLIERINLPFGVSILAMAVKSP